MGPVRDGVPPANDPDCGEVAAAPDLRRVGFAAAARTSALTMRPCGPVPARRAGSIFSLAAILRASGEIMMRPAGASEVGGLTTEDGAGVTGTGVDAAIATGVGAGAAGAVGGGVEGGGVG